MTQNTLAENVPNQQGAIVVWKRDVAQSMPAKGIAFGAGFSTYLAATVALAQSGHPVPSIGIWAGITAGCVAFALLWRARPIAHAVISSKLLAIVPVGAFCAARLLHFGPVRDLLSGVLNLQ